MNENLDWFFYRFVTIHAFDRQTDRQTEFSSLDHVCIPCSAVITISSAGKTIREYSVMCTFSEIVQEFIQDLCTQKL